MNNYFLLRCKLIIELMISLDKIKKRKISIKNVKEF